MVNFLRQKLFLIQKATENLFSGIRQENSPVMETNKTHFLPFLGEFLFLGILSLGLVKLNAYAQTSNNLSTAVEPERSRIVVNKTASVSPVISNIAAIENVRLRDSLVWSFSAKTQRGWHLYVPLIQQMLGVSANSDTPDFARSVAVWQQQSGLVPTGVIDVETLNRMVENWQSQRLNSTLYPSENELITVPIADFYDPTRSPDLLKVERETYAAYKRMTAAAAKDLNLRTTATGGLAPEEKFLKIVSAFRSREYQAKLRAASPNSGRADLAVNSPHFTGHALDLYVGGEPVKTEDFNRALQVQTPAYKWLVKNAAHFGFYPYYYEPWHWEYVPANR
ncbi:MAG: M15 family metallopeptidase [Pyrinomonadaceae bacterium]